MLKVFSRLIPHTISVSINKWMLVQISVNSILKNSCMYHCRLCLQLNKFRKKLSYNKHKELNWENTGNLNVAIFRFLIVWLWKQIRVIFSVVLFRYLKASYLFVLDLSECLNRTNRIQMLIFNIFSPLVSINTCAFLNADELK